jgi:hypothetical protein
MNPKMARAIVDTCLAHKKKFGDFPTFENTRDTRIVFKAFQVVAENK